MADLPNALRVGSPLQSREETPIPRRTLSNASRISDLLPERRSSPAIVSLPNEPPSRYASRRRDVSPPESDLTSPLSPTRAPSRSNTAYSIPSFPALPSVSALPLISESSTYDPISPVQPGGTHSAKRSRPASIIHRLASVRNGRSLLSKRGRQGPYGALAEDENERGFPAGARHQRLHSGEVDAESIGIDISGFEGPTIELHQFPQNSNPSRGLPSDDVLGSGMGNVLAASIVHSKSTGHRRGESVAADPETRHALQKEAQKTGEIVAVEEAAVDISNFGGSEYSRSNTMVTLDNPERAAKQSFFFPEDPEKPSWRPHSMRWPYITFLISIALTLGGLQEVLCQLSIRQTKKGGGLIEFTYPQQIATAAYFGWKYLGTMVLVTFGLLWQVADFEVKRLEPYYQLSKREGATAGDSLNIDYLTFMSYLIPVLAIRRKQWAVVYSSVATLLAGGLVPVLQSVSIYMTPKQSTRNEKKFVRIDPIWSRVLSGSLLAVALLGVLLLVSLRRKSGLLSDPKGIAGIASMATKSHILTDFKGLDMANNKIIHAKLRTRRYNLHKSSLWQGEYIRSSDERTATDKVENPLPLMLRLSAGLPYIIFIILVAGAIPTIIFIPGANNVTVKIPWFLTALTTIVKLVWGTLDMSVRVVEPYYILSRRHAPPKTLTLDYTGTMPGYLSIKAALNGHWLVSFVGFGAILAEVLTVCVTSFTVASRTFIEGLGGDGTDGTDESDSANGGETFRSFWVSFGLSIFITLYLIVVACSVYLRRRHKFLPRQPGSIAGVLAYIHQSRMLVDFIDTERLNSGQMTNHLENLGKKYALGWFNGRDGEDHLGVDQEPIMAAYKHGVDWKKARIAGDAVGGWEYF